MTRLVLIAGASGSGKSRLAHAAGCPSLRLDDFYHDADHPDLPRTEFGIADWDDRFALRQSSLQRQFTALETALSQMNSQSSWLSGQLASLSSGK